MTCRMPPAFRRTMERCKICYNHACCALTMSRYVLDMMKNSSVSESTCSAAMAFASGACSSRASRSVAWICCLRASLIVSCSSVRQISRHQVTDAKHGCTCLEASCPPNT